MVPWPVIGLILYGFLTWFSLKTSSNPANSCYDNNNHNKRTPPNDNCIHPMVHVGDTLSLDLWIVEATIPNKNTTTTTTTTRKNDVIQRRWKQVSTCSQLQFKLPSTGKLPMDITTISSFENEQVQQKNCTITIPDNARIRWSDGNKHGSSSGGGGPLQAKFRLYKVVEKSKQSQSPQQSQIMVGEIPLELTRIITPPKPKSSFSFSSSTKSNIGNGPTTKRKLLQDNSNEEQPNDNDDHAQPPKNKKKSELQQQPQYYPYVPKWKYGSQKLLLRFVADTQSYAPPYHRRDGIRIKESRMNQTAYLPLIYVDENGLMQSTAFDMAPPSFEQDEISSVRNENDDKDCDALSSDTNSSNAIDDSNNNNKNNNNTKNRPPPIKLNIQISSISPLWDVVNQQVTLGVGTVSTTLGLSGAELDEIRYWLRDERLYRFALTQIISTVHVWVDYMAFRDEIRFYRGKQDLGGVSPSSVLAHLACSIIIFLYLCEGGGTSWVVLLSILGGIVVEVWKVWKLLRPTVSPAFPFLKLREFKSPLEQETTKYDTIAMKWLMICLYPIVIGWSIYALYHYEYTSWYSWFISNMANAVYTFGFITLCPQLYVNYRLKSVAHLPWKVFVYKVFNTFVDDVFAFLIEMPWKHRIMTLRDDVVFLMFLLQAYMYRVDKSRTNEFGYSYDGDEDGDTSNGSDGKEEPGDEMKQPKSSDDDDDNKEAAQSIAAAVVTNEVVPDSPIKPKDKDV